MRAPNGGAMKYTQIALKLFEKMAGPKVLAGFIEAPLVFL